MWELNIFPWGAFCILDVNFVPKYFQDYCCSGIYKLTGGNSVIVVIGTLGSALLTSNLFLRSFSS